MPDSHIRHPGDPLPVGLLKVKKRVGMAGKYWFHGGGRFHFDMVCLVYQVMR